ncbi:flagellar protein FlaG [Candidatus Methylospira mobilis]|uniref:flagellar protein FlaG n=1 Tax=Candidatus Methylospira mobilis TaxID=1808979 RepID=UPI0028F0AAAB|nr:flagellar protein FlaG [Candidatus Methylospira mobilis]WNV06760.1 flagellar protein FlaG [Candidatus Methylospira mobilis]
MSISALGSTGALTAAPTNFPSQPGTTAATSASSAPDPIATPTPGTVAPVADASSGYLSAETVKKAAATVEKFINSQQNVQTQLSLDKSSGLEVVKVTDTATHQEIAQYPSKEIVALAQAINELQGLISTTGVLHNSTA